MEDKESMRKILMKIPQKWHKNRNYNTMYIIKEMTPGTIGRNEIINTLSKIIESKCNENKIFLRKQNGKN